MPIVILYYLVLFIIAGFLITVSIYISGLIYSVFMGAPYVPTQKKHIRDILKLAKLKKGQRFLEIGCGDGRVVSEAVHEYKAQGKGIEINPILITKARLIAALRKLETVEFVRADIRKMSFVDYDVIYIFLLPGIIETLKDRIEKDCKKGTIIICHGFKIDGWEKKLEYKREVKPFYTYYYRL